MINIKELRVSNLVRHDGKVLPIINIDSDRVFTNTKTKETFKGCLTLPEIDEKGNIWTTNGRWVNYCYGILLNTHNVLMHFEDVEDWGRKQDNENEESYRLLVFKNVVDGSSDLRIRFYESGFKELWIDSDEQVYISKLTEIHHLQNMFFMITGFDIDVSCV